SPVQATVVTVADRHEPYAREVADRLGEVGLRVEVDAGSGKLGEKIRRALTHKVPALLVVGDDDVSHRTAGFRLRGEDERRGTPLDEIVATMTTLAREPGS
ncbi:MAG: His/Gly/Thr/Pro-type tRNA ligase C-terminal domain-containing protein, partial [Acidimicrobiia bacterium]